MKPSTDPRVDEMLADPAAYFAKVRREAREEAEVYVARRRMGVLPKRSRKTTVDLRFPFVEGSEVVVRAKGPITPAEFDYLIAALLDMRPCFVAAAPSGEQRKEGQR